MADTQAPVAKLSEVQADVGVWARRNFGVTTVLGDLLGLLLIVQHVGKLAQAMLKHSQGIRGTPEEHLQTMADTMPKLRSAVSAFAYWSRQPVTDFPLQAAPLLGMIEEPGEIVAAVLDPALTKEKCQAEIDDGLADSLVFMLDFAGRNGADLEAVFNKTWARVRERNWQKDTVSGGE